MLKLVFTDLDGTFVDTQKQVPERNARVLDLAAERGVQFVPCTGRNANGVLPDLANHPAVRYAICCNGAALAWLCGHLGVDTADAVAFGDGDNDLSMIRAAGDGVAMANAIPEVLAAADHVTSSCDEAGVAAYLEPILSVMD